MFEELINSIGDVTNIIIPSEEDIKNISNKINNNEELDSYDLLQINKLKFCNYILKNRGGRF